MKSAVLRLLVFFAFFFSPPASMPADTTADIPALEIVRKSDDLMRGKSQEGIYSMMITTPAWERRLKLFVLTKDRDKILIRILAPAKEKGIATLRLKNEMWNYLPSVERTVKIPPSMMLQPWMGSDFANDDLVKESSIVEDYTHRVMRQETVDGETAYVIELTPKPSAGVVWDRRVVWIRKKDFIPLREEFYGKENHLVKVLLYSKIRRVSDRFIPTRWEMVSEIKKDHRTIIEVDEGLVYDQDINDERFSLFRLKTSSDNHPAHGHHR